MDGGSVVGKTKEAEESKKRVKQKDDKGERDDGGRALKHFTG